jgi:hypothetical protein
MATLKEASQRLDLLSTQISTQVRTISLGVLAVTWLFISGSKDSPALLGKIPKWELVTVACLCLIALVLDMAQYCIAFYKVRKAYDATRASKTDTNPDPKVTYPKDNWRNRFFYAKQVFAGGGALWLVVASVIALFQ